MLGSLDTNIQCEIEEIIFVIGIKPFSASFRLKFS